MRHDLVLKDVAWQAQDMSFCKARKTLKVVDKEPLRSLNLGWSKKSMVRGSFLQWGVLSLGMTHINGSMGVAPGVQASRDIDAGPCRLSKRIWGQLEKQHSAGYDSQGWQDSASIAHSGQQV